MAYDVDAMIAISDYIDHSQILDFVERHKEEDWCAPLHYEFKKRPDNPFCLTKEPLGARNAGYHVIAGGFNYWTLQLELAKHMSKELECTVMAMYWDDSPNEFDAGVFINGMTAKEYLG